MHSIVRMAACLLAAALAGPAQAQLASYSFSTTVALPYGAVFGNNFTPTPDDFAVANTLASMVQGTSVTGTFDYDPSTPLFQTNADGSVIYAAAPNGSFMNLSGTVSGGALPVSTFSDIRGFATVGNETYRLPACQGCPPSSYDIFQLTADSQSPTGTNRHIVPFSVGDFTLYNARLFWIEGQQTPNEVPDLFDSNALPSTLPVMTGRLALDFTLNGDATRQYAVFYDGLTVASVAAPIPEPETYAMLTVGLALLGFQARRRRAKPAA